MAHHLLLVPFIAALTLCACAPKAQEDKAFRAVEGGDRELGAKLLAQYQCGSCHSIPEVPAATGTLGPSLEGFGRRSYIAGRVPNNPGNLLRWVQQPQALIPGTLMPDMGVSPDDARDIAAYLLSLS